MNEQALEEYIAGTFENVEWSENYGYRFFFYGDDHRLPFATIAYSDNEYETISNLNRPGVFRLNIGVSKDTFQKLFGTDEIDTSAWDYTELNRLMPHPDYHKQFFVCILNPGAEHLEQVKAMLAESHGLAKARYDKLSQGKA